MATVMAGRCGPNWRATSARPDLSRDRVWSTAGKKDMSRYNRRTMSHAPAVRAQLAQPPQHRQTLPMKCTACMLIARLHGVGVEPMRPTTPALTVDLLWGFILAGSRRRETFADVRMSPSRSDLIN